MTQRTYWHLQGLGRVPSEYDIASSRLLYYPALGFAVDTPVSAWYARHQVASPLRLRDWEVFRDPRETTYSSYVSTHAGAQSFLDAIYRSAGDDYDRSLDTEWVSKLERLLPVLLYPCHALQMLAAYVGQMAPAGRVVIASLFQASDEMRRTQVLAYRTRLLERSFPGFGRDAKAAWQHEPEWQPLRRMLEHMLVTYDFGEALVALAFAFKPRFDRWLEAALRAGARQHDDPLLEKLVFSLAEDTLWHRAWTHELLRLLVADDAQQRQRIEGWLSSWAPRARESLAALDALVPPEPEGRDRLGEIELSCRQDARRAGLHVEVLG